MATAKLSSVIIDVRLGECLAAMALAMWLASLPTSMRSKVMPSNRPLPR